MLPPPKNNQRGTIISPKLSRAYDNQIAIVEASHQEASTATAEYWWALYVIKRDNLWRAKYEEGKFKEWLSDLRRERFGPSKSDFYMVLGTIERLMRGGMVEEDVKPLLGSLTTALKGDLKELFDRNGKGDLKPEILAKLEDDNESFPEFVERLQDLGPGEQRTQVSRLRTKDHIFFTDEFDYDELTGRWMGNVRWESDEDGTVYTGTVIITATETTAKKKFPRKPNYLPEKIARYIESRFGISE